SDRGTHGKPSRLCPRDRIKPPVSTCAGVREVSMKWLGFLLAMVPLVLSSAQADDKLMAELAPTGKLRVALAVSPAPSALYVIKDASTGSYRGVTVDLGTAMAKKLGVPVEFVPYLASGEITNAADKGVWDVTFMPYDAERAKSVDFGPAYHILQSTYLVAPGS